MIGALLQSEIDISVSQTTPEQQLVAWVVVCIAALIVAWRLWSTHYAGLPERLKRAKADLRGARKDTRLLQAYLSAEEASDPATVKETARSLLGGEESDDPRVRDAANSVRGALAETWTPYWTRLPKTPRRIGALGILVALLGSAAVSTEVILAVLESSGPGIAPLRWPGLAVTHTVRVGELAVELLQAVPIVGSLLTLLFTIALTAVSLAFPAWYLWAAALLAGAAGIAYLERQVVDDVTPNWADRLPEPAAIGRTVALAGFGIWAFVLVGVGLGRLAGTPQLGTRFGAAAGFGILLTFATVAGVRLRQHVDELPTLDRIRDADTRVKQYLAVRYASFAAAAVAGALVPVYAAVALTKLPTLVRGLLAASASVQAVVFLVLAVVTAILSWQAREAWGDVQSALAITAARQQVRALVVGTGLPIAVVAVTYTIVSGITKSIPIGVAGAVGAGLLARTGLSLVTRVRYRAGLRESVDHPARRIVVEAAALETRDETQEYVRINGDTELLHPDRDQLLTDAADVATALVNDGDDAEKPISEWHAQFAFDIGITDPDETEAKLVERPRKHLYTELRNNGGRIPVETLDNEIGEYPEEYVDGLLWREEYSRGNITTGEDYVILRNDPYGG